jgi:hypothetical protein
MRIAEILFPNNNATEGNRSDPVLDPSPASSNNDLTNLATAFTRRGLVKHFLNLNGSEGQPAATGSAHATVFRSRMKPSGAR